MVRFALVLLAAVLPWASGKGPHYSCTPNPDLTQSGSGYYIWGTFVKDFEFNVAPDQCFYGVGFTRCKHDWQWTREQPMDPASEYPSSPFTWKEVFDKDGSKEDEQWCLECCSRTRLSYAMNATWQLTCDVSSVGNQGFPASCFGTAIDYDFRNYEFRFATRQTMGDVETWTTCPLVRTPLPVDAPPNITLPDVCGGSCVPPSVEYDTCNLYCEPCLKDKLNWAEKCPDCTQEINEGRCNITSAPTPAPTVDPAPPKILTTMGYHLTLEIVEERTGANFWRGVRSCNATAMEVEKNGPDDPMVSGLFFERITVIVNGAARTAGARGALLLAAAALLRTSW